MTTAPTTAPDGGPDDDAAARMIACAYCREDVIPANAFSYLSELELLLTAVCPACDRRVTMTSRTLASWKSSDDIQGWA